MHRAARGSKDPTQHPESCKEIPGQGKQRHRGVERCPWMVSLAMAEDMLDVLVPALKIPPPEQEARAKSLLC